MAKYIMALDAGTTSNRCILFDEKGELCSVARRKLTQHSPKLGWVEQIFAELDIHQCMFSEVRPSSCIYGEADPSFHGGAVPITGAAVDQQVTLFWRRWRRIRRSGSHRWKPLIWPGLLWDSAPIKKNL